MKPAPAGPKPVGPEAEGSHEPIFQTRIFIEKDGTVVFENLSEELLALVQELDPDGELGLACRRESPPAIQLGGEPSLVLHGDR
jgi:hypothetical protein